MNKVSGNIFSNNINYKFATIPTFHEEKVNRRSEPEKDQLCLIVVKHTKKNRELVHPFSEFVLEFKNKSYNTMKNRAETVVRFLNFILNNNHDYKLKSFSKLEKIHGEDYLNSLRRNGCSKSYFMREENNLTKFYYFLSKKELLDSDELKEHMFKWEETTMREKKIKYLVPIFKDAKQPSSKGENKPLHNIDEEMLPDFLDLAARITPHIALGIYLQIFGGLRPSEVVTCSTTCATLYGPYGTNGMTLDIRTRYFSKNPTRKSAHSKRGRIQNIEVFGNYLPDFYRNHIEKYLPKDDTLALFSNTRGRAMSYSVYYYQFKKLMLAFIGFLESSGNTNWEIFAMTLKTVKAGPHLGRGIFSNLMAEILDDTRLMEARGDKNPDSVRPYRVNISLQ